MLIWIDGGVCDPITREEMQYIIRSNETNNFIKIIKRRLWGGNNVVHTVILCEMIGHGGGPGGWCTFGGGAVWLVAQFHLDGALQLKRCCYFFFIWSIHFFILSSYILYKGGSSELTWHAPQLSFTVSRSLALFRNSSPRLYYMCL